MAKTNRYNTYRRLRRSSQIIFFALFLYLLLRTSIDTFSSPNALPRISAPVGFFLEIDPLVAISTVIATHTLYRNLIWAVAVIVGTIFFGRFFCGWICPMGTLNHAVSAIKGGKLKGKKRLDSNRYKPYQRWKYGILVFFLGASVFTSLLIGFLDPVAFLTRSMALVVTPAYNALTHSAFEATGALHGNALLNSVNIIGSAIQFVFIRSNDVHFQGAALIGILFLAVLLANRHITRFWCRGICPLGGLLGLLSRFSVFGMEKHPSLCTDCNKCALNCQGGDDPQPGYTWRQAECHLCLNCVADCSEAGLEFKFFPGRKETTQEINLKRRAVMAAVAGGFAAVPVLRTSANVVKRDDPSLVRPPGSVIENDFLGRCIRCGECMNVCPNNALHPTMLQAGMEAMWTPILVPRVGYCEPTCILCSQVCPTGAINELTEKEKAWVPVKGQEKTSNPPLRIGTAFYDHGRCLPWAMATECIVCEEWCPTSPKAIYFEMVETIDREGKTVTLKRPHVDPTLCVGCGACVYACPIKGAPAIYVTNVGETRNPSNSITLKAPRVG